MKAFRTIALSDVLTPSEIARARALYREQSDETFNTRVVRELIAPNMARINKALGQENDARYIGYAVEYCLMNRPEKRKTGPKWSRAHA